MLSPAEVNRRLREAGGINFVIYRVSEADSLRSVAQQIGIAYTSLRRWIDADPERRRLYDAAWVDAGDHLAELARETLENCEETKNAISKARAKADQYMREARIRKPQKYMEQTKLNVEDVTKLSDEEIKARITGVAERAKGAET